MTNLAQRVAIATSKPRVFADTPEQNPGLLILDPDPGVNYPATIKLYVYTFLDSGTAVAGYATSEDSQTFYSGGFEWLYRPKSPYALFITFVFLTNTPTYATRIQCDKLPYSDTYTGAQTQDEQDLCIPIPTDENAYAYSFHVDYSDGTHHDPQIVVTPIPS